LLAARRRVGDDPAMLGGLGRRVIAVLVALGLGAGCGGDGRDGPPRSPPYASGSRLRANLLDGGDGAVLFDGWRDLELELDCDLAIAADGRWRCLPRDAAEVAFGDADCTTPVTFELDRGCAPARFARGPAAGADACEPARTEVYDVGELGAGQIYFGEPGRCAAFGFATYHALSPADPARFAGEASRATEARGGRLAVTVVTMDDGARQIAELVDPIRGEPCERWPIADGETVCASTAQAWIGAAFVDDQCATAADAWLDDVCEAHLPAAVPGGPGLSLLGERVAGPVFSTQTGTCTLAPGRTAFRRGRLATAEDFPLVSTAWSGTGALQAIYAADHLDRPLRPLALVDQVTSESCLIVRTAGSETLRCLPGSRGLVAGNSRYFADADCTQRVALLSPDGPLPSSVAEADPPCGRDVWTLNLLATVRDYAGPVFESFDGGATCTPTDRLDGLRYALADPLPIDTLPSITRRIE
jgi:hypothetical protein